MVTTADLSIVPSQNIVELGGLGPEQVVAPKVASGEGTNTESGVRRLTGPRHLRPARLDFRSSAQPLAGAFTSIYRPIPSITMPRAAPHSFIRLPWSPSGVFMDQTINVPYGDPPL